MAEFPKLWRSSELFIQAVKSQNNLNAFLTYSWRFLISNKLEHYNSCLKKYWHLEIAGKVRKRYIISKKDQGLFGSRIKSALINAQEINFKI